MLNKDKEIGKNLYKSEELIKEINYFYWLLYKNKPTEEVTKSYIKADEKLRENKTTKYFL